MEDYKEKYEQALSQAEKELKCCGSLDCDAARQIFRLFPELKESEDERIRKSIIRLIQRGGYMSPEDKDKAYAWLEKQGEREHVVIPKFKVGDTIRRKGSSAEYTIESISGECYHGKGWGLLISYDDDYELVEQKPTWSEEDEHCIELLLPIIDSSSLIPKNRKKCKKFLKSLKERVQPQPNQEWSEEEKARIDKIIDVLDWAEEKGRISYSDWEDYVCYVKSLKPQSTWKPSKEQMEALWNAVPNIPNSEKDIDTITELSVLYEDLKKLREE